MRQFIDVDSHLTEPRDLFTERVSKKWGDLVPHVGYDDKAGEEAWYIGDVRIGAAWANASVGWEEEWPPYPRMQSDAVPSSYDAAERVGLLDELGISKQVLYPNVAGFGGQKFLTLGEPALMLECVRAYNDFLTEWMSFAPDRFIGISALPFWDVDLAIEEVVRTASMGHHGIIFPGSPHQLGYPFLSDPHWHPLWSTAQDLKLPVSFHVGSGDMMKALNPERAKFEGRQGFACRLPTELFLGVGIQLNDLLYSGILPRFPDLDFILVESGIGAIPFILESADYHFTSNGYAREMPIFKMTPSEYFRRQVFGTFWFERPKLDEIEKIGLENVLFETDFPHPTCLHGAEVHSKIEEIKKELGTDKADQVMRANAERLYRFESTR